MTGRAGVAWGLLCLLLVLNAVHLGLLFLNRGIEAPSAFGLRGVEPFFALPTAAMAALVTGRQPRNPIGWLLFLGAFSYTLQNIAAEYAIRAILADPGSLPAGDYAAWLQEWVWTPALAIALPGLLFFPDGKLPSRRWRPLVWLSVPTLAWLGFVDSTGPLSLASYAENPLPLPALPEDPGFFLVCVLLLPATVLAPILRFRRAGPIERQQMKLLALAGLAFAIVFPPALIVSGSSTGIVRDSAEILILLALLGFPVSFAIAILRYRLYDIDRIINRTLTYGLLTATLGATYFGLVVGLQALLRPLTGAHDLAIVLTTLVVAALFLPARRTVQRAVDRRFNRRAYGAARTIEVFNTRLRQQVDLDTLRHELLAVVGETMQPDRVWLWLRDRNDLGTV